MEPFIKWAGGKRWLAKKYDFLLPKVEEINYYIEPFLGGGSMFFHLCPQKGILNDINIELIKTYREIKTNWNQIQSELEKLHEAHNQDLYYTIRNQKPTNDTEIAIRFLYLNRTCWNGLYRVNKNNEFNVPIGTKTNVIINTDDFEQASKLLKGVELFSQDFEGIILNSKEKDFVFIDPPYTVKHNNNGFIKYNENLFSWDDQVRLRDSVKEAIDRGTKVLVLNANHDSIREIYQNLGDFHIVSRSSVISGQKGGLSLPRLVSQFRLEFKPLVDTQLAS